MDDITTRTSAWLAFTLAFDASARLCDHLRQEGFTPEQISKLIAGYRRNNPAATNSALESAVEQVLSASQLGVLRSSTLQQKISTALDWAQAQPEHHLLALDDKRYPAQLLDTASPPPLLYAKGDLSALESPALAIVGSRKASRQAIDLTRELAFSLARRGVTIVSGLARGIDAAAHEGALDAGGRTIAVAATEPTSVYPKIHAGLERRIIDAQGLILTEYPLGAPTLRWYFPRRNRIISGMSVGVLVAEAGLPSGTLTTAAHAANQGREVMAVPGSVSNPLAKGCHALIKQGAALVECEQDILEILNLTSACTLPINAEHIGDSCTNTERRNMHHPDPTNKLESLIWQALAAAPASIDELMAQHICTVTELSATLGLMEIEGRIRADSGGRYARC